MRSFIHVVLPAMLFCIADAHSTALFEDDAVIDLTLSGPIEALIDDRDRHDDDDDDGAPEERPFLLSSGGTSHPVEVRVRGHSRLRVCGFPPLRLDFPAAGQESTVFAGQDKLKLVTHCRDSARGEQDLLEEYAAYRIFNVLSDASYRVRLLRIEYRDTDAPAGTPATTRFGFVIEPAAQLAARIGARPVALPGLPVKRHDLDQAALIYVFQYLIANTDWGLVNPDYDEACCHNVDLFEVDSVVLPVPYDFDIAGLVDARYAFPDPSLRIKRVTQRRYRGLCTDRDVLRRAIRAVKSAQTEILEVVRELPGLTDRNRRGSSRFLGAFFEQAGDEDKLLRRFERRCL